MRTFIYLELQLSQFSAKSAKKKIFQNFKNLIGFFSDFFLQNHKTRKLRYLTFHGLHVCQVSGEKKNDLSMLVFLNQNSPNFTIISLIFNLKSEFFRIFQKKLANFRKLRYLTYLELQLSQFSGKSGTKKFSLSLSLHFTFTSLHFHDHGTGRSRQV